MSDGPNRLKARRLGVDTHSEAVVFLRKNSPICRSEGFASHNRVLVCAGERRIIATLYQVESSGFLETDEAGLSDAAWQGLAVEAGADIVVKHSPPLESLSLIRSRIYGNDLGEEALRAIVTDIVAGRYSTIEISSFITACAARPLSRSEVLGLTRAMVDAGRRLSWDVPVVVDKHSVGGIPGNRTTPIVVSIAASLGLVMPKTSSRAITSPAGTADTMETLTRVDLSATEIRDVVLREGGCIAWGGAVGLSPADDILIRVERALDLDTEGQMIASVLSKKIAAGATHLVLDVPFGPTAKVRSESAAQRMSAGLLAVAKEFGIHARVVAGDGSQPIGRGLGPALEARDVLSVLKGDADAPADLRARSLALAGALLELSGRARPGEGDALASSALDSGRAWTKFRNICEAQGAFREPPVSRHRKPLLAPRHGVVCDIDNRKIARLAKLAGAPEDKAAGVELHVRLGDTVARGAPVCTVHAEWPGELDYALGYAEANPDIVRVTDL
jgi:thymidine phosphorylase